MSASIKNFFLGLKNKKYLKENLVKFIFFISAIFCIIIIFSILYFLIQETYPFPTDIGSFVSGLEWKPTDSPARYGALPLIVGTFLVTIGAMVIAIPLSIGAAIFISEIATERIRSIIKPIIELLAGIPSVVYGFFGLIMITEFIEENLNPTFGHGETWLAGSIILGIMAIPTITSVAEDAINAVPRHHREGSLAMGATKWQTISRVVTPSALSGITAAIILGIGRAVGETMAILMVCGNAAIIPDPITDVFSPIKTLTSTLGIEMGESGFGTPHYHALFGVAVLLMIISLVVNTSAVFILERIKQKQMATGKIKKKKIFNLKLSIERKEKIKSYIKYLILLFLLYIVYSASGLYFTISLVAIALIFNFLFKKMSAKNVQRVAFGTLLMSLITIFIFLGILLFYIVSSGAGALSWEFITEAPSDLGRAGGISTAIVGTLYLVAGAIAIALPIGVGGAIYLNEYTQEGKIRKIIRTGADLLNGTPSIVFGLFGLAFLVYALGIGKSLLAGQITLAFMIVPTILRTSEEALRSVPMSIREGSLALGATKWQTIKRVVLSPAAPGIITGSILSIGRAAGETAPIMFVAVTFSSIFPGSLFERVNALPYHMFVISTNVPGDAAKQAAGGTALVLLIIVIAFYLVAIIIRNFYKKKLKW